MTSPFNPPQTPLLRGTVVVDAYQDRIPVTTFTSMRPVTSRVSCQAVALDGLQSLQQLRDRLLDEFSQPLDHHRESMYSPNAFQLKNIFVRFPDGSSDLELTDLHWTGILSMVEQSHGYLRLDVVFN